MESAPLDILHRQRTELKSFGGKSLGSGATTIQEREEAWR
jgi:hypothetical protein